MLGFTFLFIFSMASTFSWSIADELVGAEREERSAVPRRLNYSLSSQTLTMSQWVYRGSRVNWDGNPLAEASCEFNGAPATIQLAAKQTSGDPEYACQENTLLALPLAEFISKNMMSCVQTAMRLSGIAGTVTSLRLQHNGIMNSRRVRNARCDGKSLESGKQRNCSISLHATGRAIDVEMFDVTLSNGQRLSLPGSCKTSEGEYRRGFERPSCTRTVPYGTFYDQFVQCWGDKIREEYPQCPENQRGVLDCGNPNHVDHLHLSVPLCPKPRGIATT